MKMKILALLVIAALPLMAFDCITDPSKINITLKSSPLSVTFPLNPGPSKTYGGTAPAINPSAIFNSGYTVTGVSIYDITVQTVGNEDLGAGGGTVSVKVGTNGTTTLLFSYTGTWNQFKTPQSLLTSSAITLNPAGGSEIVRALNSQPPLTLTFSAAGTVTTAPQQTGDALTVSVYMQASGHRN